MRFSIYILCLMMTLSLLQSCSYGTNYTYSEKQSEIVSNYKMKGYFEYNSRLNDVMVSELNNYDSQMMPEDTRNAILEAAEKLEKERPTAGCYVIEWDPQVSKNAKDNAITVEWNSEAGVIIRMFTNSVQVAKRLPTQSY
ncbi:hypothetical protein [Flavobacterium sp. BFFFF1]|nr:hypothetical protein [Flavobacterium sp. BFFFF1]